MTILTIPHFGLKRQYSNLRDELLQATDDVLNEGILVDGEYTHKFETWLAKKNKCNYAIVTHSGTQALEFIAQYVRFRALSDNSSKPKIILPDLSYPATLNAFLSNDWEVELSDTNKYGCLPVDNLEDLSSLPGISNHVYHCYVGLYGAEAPLYFNKRTIVDGAQHWLSAFGNVGMGMAISFDPTKNLNASGNGGAVVTRDKGLAEFVREKKNNGKPEHNYHGTNSKMSEIDCAHLLVRAQYIDEWQERRNQIAEMYLSGFVGLPLRCLSEGAYHHSYQKFVIYTDDRNNLHSYLKEHGVVSKIHYPYALSELPVATGLVKPNLLSTSVMLSRGVLSLPIYPELTDIEVTYVIDKVKKFYDR
jgi:dTDP-4-amino-4,6-dideoxygalactose transaminase